MGSQAIVMYSSFCRSTPDSLKPDWFSIDPLFVHLHGTEDRFVLIQVAQTFNTKLEAAGVKMGFIRIDDDYDILTNEAMNLQARNILEPILRMVFKLQDGTLSVFYSLWDGFLYV